MRYEPVKVLTLFHRIYTKSNKFIRETPCFYQVRSNLLGSCGHKHRTLKAAEPCKRRMQTAWSARRAAASRAAYARRTA